MKVLYISRGQFEPRWLLPAYRLNDSVVAWECGTCGKLFSISVEEAVATATQVPPQYIEQEFRLHSCELHLCSRFSDVEIYPAEGVARGGSTVKSERRFVVEFGGKSGLMTLGNLDQHCQTPTRGRNVCYDS